MGLALACLMPLATAAPASADAFNMFADRLLYSSSAINFCVSAHNAESHTYWYATTYAGKETTVTVPYVAEHRLIREADGSVGEWIVTPPDLADRIGAAARSLP